MVEAGGTWAGSWPSGSASVGRVGSTEIAVREYPPGENEIIAAFVKDLNHKRGAHYAIIAKPDAVERNRPAVDYIIADRERSPEVAIEVSRTWRSEAAGKEDADWWKWVQRVRDLVRDQVAGAFRIATPMTIPARFPPEPFAADLIVQLSKERARLAALHLDNNKGAFLNIQGIEVFVTYGGTAVTSRRAAGCPRMRAVIFRNTLSGYWSGRLGSSRSRNRRDGRHGSWSITPSGRRCRRMKSERSSSRLSPRRTTTSTMWVSCPEIRRTMRGSLGFDRHAAGIPWLAGAGRIVRTR